MPVLERGHVLDHFSIGLLASMGIFLVRVHFQPAVGVISVGDHIVDTGSSLQGRGKIRDCSRSSLQALFSHLKVAVTDYGIVPCNPSLVEDKLKEAARKCDIVVVIDYDIEGGGRQDTVKGALEEVGNVKIGKVCMKNASGTTVASCLPSRGPGGGVKFAPRPSIRENGHSPRIVFSVPGNQVGSCQAVTRLLVEPCIRRMKGRDSEDCRPKAVQADIEGGWKGGDEVEVEPCKVTLEGGRIMGRPGGVGNTLVPWIDANGILVKEKGGGGRTGTVVLVDTGKDTAMNLLGDGWVGERGGGRGSSVASSDSGSIRSSRSSMSSFSERGSSAPPPNPKTLPIRVPSVVPEVEAAAVETVKATPPPIPAARRSVASEPGASNGSAAASAPPPVPPAKPAKPPPLPRKKTVTINDDKAAANGDKTSTNPKELVRSKSQTMMLLSDEEFEGIFGVTKDAFEKMAKWRQTNLRKQKGYF